MNRNYFLVFIILIAFFVASGCTRESHPLFCTAEQPCQEAATPFCDIDGSFSGLGSNCIAVPDTIPTCTTDTDCSTVATLALCSDNSNFCTQCWADAEPNTSCAAKDVTTPECRIDGACGCTDTSCMGATPFCGSDGLCRGCMLDSECDSGVCDIASAQCINTADVLYVDPAGSLGPCTKTMPCQTLDQAKDELNATTEWILLVAGTHSGAITIADTAKIVGEDGAVYMDNLTLEGDDSSVRNMVFQGAGITASGGGTLEIREVTIDGSGGAGITASGGGTLEIREVTIDGSGGAGITASGGGTLEIREVTIDGSGGAGITASGGGTLVVSQSVLRENTGPGIRVSDDRSFTVENCIIEDNGAEGIQLVSQNSTSLTQEINFSTIADNGGSDITCASGSAFSITNSIVWGASGISDIAQCTFSYTTVQGTVPTGTGNKNEDPMFVDTTNFELTVGSPAIDAADPTATITVDVDGTTRPQGPAPDMGAQEFMP